MASLVFSNQSWPWQRGKGQPSQSGSPSQARRDGGGTHRQERVDGVLVVVVERPLLDEPDHERERDLAQQAVGHVGNARLLANLVHVEPQHRERSDGLDVVGEREHEDLVRVVLEQGRRRVGHGRGDDRVHLVLAGEVAEAAGGEE